MNQQEQFDLLKEAFNDERNIEIVTGGMDAMQRGRAPFHVMAMIAERISGRHNLSAEVFTGKAIVLYKDLRAKHPPCIVISPNYGQSPSPNAMAYRSTASALIQVFEGGVDDRDLAVDSENPSNWIETKGRVLLH